MSVGCDPVGEAQHAPSRVTPSSLSYVRPFWDSIAVMVQVLHLRYPVSGTR